MFCKILPSPVYLSSCDEYAHILHLDYVWQPFPSVYISTLYSDLLLYWCILLSMLIFVRLPTDLDMIKSFPHIQTLLSPHKTHSSALHYNRLSDIQQTSRLLSDVRHPTESGCATTISFVQLDRGSSSSISLVTWPSVVSESYFVAFFSS